MKPSVPETLVNFAEKLRSEIAPQLAGFSAGNAGMIAAMLDMVAEQWDGAADLLSKENAVLRGLVERGMAQFPGSGASLPSAAADLRISSLEAENEALRDGLIAIQQALESDGVDATGGLGDAIWIALRDGVEARRVGSANF